MTAWSRSRVIKALEKIAPGIWTKPSEEWDGHKGGIWTTGEEGYQNGEEYIQPFDYWNEEHKIHPKVQAMLDKAGWYGEWNDPGTMFLWRS